METLWEISKVIAGVLGLLKAPAKLFRGAETEAESLKLDLKILQATLNDLFEPRLAFVNVVLKEVGALSERVEFVLETYRRNLGQRLSKRSVVNLINPASSDSRINEVLSIQQRFARLRLRSRRQGSRSTSFGFFKDNELVGIQSEKEELVRLLITPSGERSVISLVCSGGVVKTTLASVVYQSEAVRKRFDCRAWINVSQTYYLKDLLSRVTKMICPNEDSVDGEMDMMPGRFNPLFRFLVKKRYVIVFDGVRHPDVFHFINEFLPENGNGSKIIITTSDNAIATSCDIVQTLHPLSEHRAMDLFYKSTLTDFYGFIARFDLGSYLEEFSLKTIRRCHGFPHVVRAMGDILTSRGNLRAIQDFVSEWQVLLDNFKDEIGEDLSHIEEISRIFYHNCDKLPSRSRLCLLYFGIFPKDYLVPDVKLVKLWVAEGFVKEEMGKTLEQVAETYLDDLINRNLVQVSHINYDGTERLCSVHSFVHKIISGRAGTYKIRQALNETSTGLTKLVNEKVKRLSVYGDAVNALEVATEHPHICSVFLFGVNGIMIRKSSMVNLFEKFKNLELLDFENAPIDDLPNEVGNLSLLKYLSLRNTNIKKLPKSVGRLFNLQTLDVRNTLMHELPIYIQKLRKLRHILASAHNNKVSLDSVHGVQIKEGIGCLENLQTLMTVEARSSALGVIEELKKLRQLRCLSISKLTADMVSTLCSFIETMNLLESLSLYLSTDRETFDLEAISSPPPLLRRLILKGRLEKLPDWILRLQNLIVLGLSFSRLAVDPLKALQVLPNLKFLWLHRAYNGEQLNFEGVGFEKLRQLVLTELQYLQTVRIEGGALPMLEELRLGPCQNDLSIDIQNLKNLQLIECFDMSDEFVLRLQPEGGSEYWKIRHVESVLFRYRFCDSRYVSYRIGEPDLRDRLKRLVRTTSNVEFYCRQLSFFYNDDEEVARTSNAEWIDQYSCFTDDVED